MSNDTAVVVKEEAQAPAAAGYFETFKPANMEEALRVCEMLAKSGMVPKGYAGNTSAVFTAAMLGGRHGMDPVTSCQHIANINGKPALYGDAPLALVRASGLLTSFREWEDAEGEDFTAHCEAVRANGEKVTRSFSYADARAAKLLNKQGPWTEYPKRQCMFRARGFTLRDLFGDVLLGLAIGEEVDDIPAPKDMGQAEVVTPDAPEASSTADRIKNKIAPAGADAGKAGSTSPAPESTDPAPAQDSPPEDVQKIAADFLLEIGKAESLEALGEIGTRIQSSSAEVQRAVRATYKAKGKAFADEAAKAAGAK